MGFDIVSEEPPKEIYEGMIIMYKVSPLFGIKTTWVTEVTNVKNGYYFYKDSQGEVKYTAECTEGSGGCMTLFLTHEEGYFVRAVFDLELIENFETFGHELSEFVNGLFVEEAAYGSFHKFAFLCISFVLVLLIIRVIGKKQN